jgi:hypothetical protein
MFLVIDNSGASPVEDAEIPLDRATQAWLARVALATGTSPGMVIASILRDVREDDEAMHPTVRPALKLLTGGRYVEEGKRRQEGGGEAV